MSGVILYSGDGSKEEKRLAQQEWMLQSVAYRIIKIMRERGVKKTELAERLEVGRSSVTQLLSGERNLTLRKLSDIFFALGVKDVFDALQEKPNNYSESEIADVISELQADFENSFTQENDRSGLNSDTGGCFSMNIPNLLMDVSVSKTHIDYLIHPTVENRQEIEEDRRDKDAQLRYVA